jgi:hypothetical protein
LRAKHAKLDNLFLTEMLLQLVIDFVLVNRVLTLFEKIGVAQRSFFTGT